jgi:membrane protein implicated in regulation of membrane protease activity
MTHVLLAIGVGIAIGLGLVILILTARLVIAQVNPTFNSLENVQDFIGTVAEVIIDITPNEFGSIRVKKNGSTLKLRAVTCEPRRLKAGDRVVIIDIKNNQAWVTPIE